MALEPKAGLVISYDFLWQEQADAGLEDGAKDRPCAIILAGRERADGSREVVLCPITHSAPRGAESGVRVPPKVAAHLGLDNEQSWIKTHQVNVVRWEKGRIPFGVSQASSGEWSYGQLPQPLGREVYQQVRARSQARSLAYVRRDEGFTPEQSRDRDDGQER